MVHPEYHNVIALYGLQKYSLVVKISVQERPQNRIKNPTLILRIKSFMGKELNK